MAERSHGASPGPADRLMAAPSRPALPPPPASHPFYGKLILIIAFSLLGSTVLLELRLLKLLAIPLLFAALPIGLGLMSLLVATQFRTFSDNVPVLLRIVWLFLVVCVMVFIFLIAAHDNGNVTGGEPAGNSITLIEFVPKWDIVLIPLWVFAGISGIVTMWAVLRVLYLSVKLKRISNSSADVLFKAQARRRKALLVAFPLVAFVCIFVPFLSLLWMRLVEEADSIPWHAVFIPLWLCDGFFVCGGALLLLFTCGAREDATFSIKEILSFLGIVPSFIAFKVLLAIYLDGGEDAIHLVIVPVPLLVLEVLVVCCGTSLVFGSRGRKRRKEGDEASGFQHQHSYGRNGSSSTEESDDRGL